MVSAGFTPLNRLVYPYNDPFIVALNRYLNYENLNYTQPTQISYYPQELRDRIALALNSRPIGTQSATTPATTPTIRNV